MKEMTLDAQQIQEIIPHRPPFLFVDEITELNPEGKVVGIKTFKGDEPFFEGHFPGRPLVPGVLIVEAMAQAGAVGVLAMPEHKGKIALLVGMNGVRFRKPVLPRDCVSLEVTLTKIRGPIGKGSARAFVGGAVVAEAELTFALTAP